MLERWLETALQMSYEPADFYTGARKILRNKIITFQANDIVDDLELSDIGYTKAKMTRMIKWYYVEEGIKVAQMLWELRKSKRKYGSVGFHTYNHYLKNDPDKKSLRASVMGPCIQAINLTYLEKTHTTAVDVYYRTTEYYKKFPADLIFLRDIIFPKFDFDKAPIQEVNLYFAGLTCHPMYFITLLPHVDDPVETIKKLRDKDPYFWNWVVKWTARYLVEEHFHGIEKYMQAMRVRTTMLEIMPKRFIRALVPYLREVHPGYRNTNLQPASGEED